MWQCCSLFVAASGAWRILVYAYVDFSSKKSHTWFDPVVLRVFKACSLLEVLVRPGRTLLISTNARAVACGQEAPTIITENRTKWCAKAQYDIEVVNGNDLREAGVYSCHVWP